ncbi:type II/IV secretion system protein [Candidatus Falkowbacteria bacterium]|nr:type II/IV secretion system protein [Candidatus Falkowbacteria bacterium]
MLTKDLLGQATAEFYKVPYSDLNSNQPSKEQVLKIREEVAKKFRVVLFSEEKKGITVTTNDPSQKNLKTELAKLFPKIKISITYSLPEDIDANFVHYKKSLETRFSKIIKKEKRVAPEILEEIFADALVYRASDIHFEPQAKDVVVRFRVDGVLYEAGRLNREYYENILNRVKVQSGMRIDEHFAAQDGSLRYIKESLAVDMRASVAPTIEGEKIVLRVLSAYVQGFVLGELGLSSAHQILLEEASKKPFGMIIVTGPTGSGKTTTLYALLRILNQPEVNITTIEDPVEYKVLGVNQIQVNPLTNLTFAKGLRSIVRQDPDIILVGEIRDKETAEIAVNAALTGHLLLTTFHANDAATAIPRLLDMGTEPFLLASTLEVVIAQRLVRKICDHCRHSISLQTKNIKSPLVKRFFEKGSVTLYKGKGCEACSHTGYKGRTAIFEFIQIFPEMQKLILQNPSTQQIWELARKQNARSMFEDGIEKVKSGITTLEELLRVAEAPVN